MLTPVIHELLTLEASDVRLVSDEMPDFTSYRNFDVAILYGEHASQHHDLESLGVDVFTPVCRPDIAPRLRSANSLVRLPLLVNETAAVTWDDWLKLNGVSAPPRKRLHFNRAAHIISSLLNGVGVALESLRLMSPHLQRGDLVCCPIRSSRPIARELTFLYVTQDPSRRERAEKVAKLIRAQCSTDEHGFPSGSRQLQRLADNKPQKRRSN